MKDHHRLAAYLAYDRIPPKQALEAAERFHELACRMQPLAESVCSEELSMEAAQRIARTQAKLEQKVRDLVATLPGVILHEINKGNPVAPPIKLKLPSGASNGWEHGIWCVTR